MAARKHAPDAEIQRLYRLPPEEFTPARNELAKRLRKEGQKDAAAEVQALPKPTPSAWAVNALFERQPKKMEALLGAGKRARAAQREAVSGRGAEALRESIRAARALSDELRWEAGQILAERGKPPSRTVMERIAANLQALAFSPAASEAAARGWLDRDLEPPGFEVLAGLQVAGAPVVDLAARREAQRQAEEEKERPARAVQQEARHRGEAAEKARREREEREAEKLRKQIEAAEEKLERARAEADALGQEAKEAEKAAADLRRQAEAAERAAERAREKAEKAAERLERAREELRGAKTE
ncbi:MAG TPA: hypothetical protein VIC28_08620 [Thermoanaerobaculia bacterium]